MTIPAQNIKTDKILSRDRNGNKTGVCGVKKNGRDD